MVVMEEKVEEDSLVPAAVRTMAQLRKMADTIHPMIQLEEDHPFNHHDGKLLILLLESPCPSVRHKICRIVYSQCIYDVYDAIIMMMTIIIICVRCDHHDHDDHHHHLCTMR